MSDGEWNDDTYVDDCESVLGLLYAAVYALQSLAQNFGGAERFEFHSSALFTSLFENSPLPIAASHMKLQPHLVIAGNETLVHRLVFLPGAQRLVAGHRDGTIRMWNVENGKQEGAPMKHEGSIGSLVVTGDGTKLVSCVQTSIKMWNLDSQALVEEWTRPHTYPQVAISPDDRFIAIGDKELTLCHLDGGPEIKHPIKFKGKVYAMRFSPNERSLKLACVISYYVYVFDIGRGETVFNPLRRDDCYARKVLLWSLDGSQLFSAWTDGTIRCFNPDTGEPIGQAWIGHTKYIDSLSHCPLMDLRFALCVSGELVASAGKDRKICLWQISHPVESQAGLAFHDVHSGFTDIPLMVPQRSSPRPMGRLTVQIPYDEDLHNTLDAPSRSKEAASLSGPSSACDQFTMMSEQSQMSRLSVKVPPLDLTPYIVRISDRYSAGGGFGDVYKFRLQVQVVVKAFRFKFPFAGEAHNKSFKMLRRELGIWKRLNHINVVPFLGIAYGFGMHGAMSLVSLWMSNDTLQNFLAKCDDDLGVEHRLQFLLDIANGLQYLHSFPIVHGDLNCNNVLLDADYTARLADFGYSSLVGKIPEALTYLQRSTTRPGALRWTAPEQIDLEDTFRWTTGNDIYSFGCVLSGKQPWSEVREDAAVVLRLAKGYKPSRPKSRPVDDLHWNLIERCWSLIQERPAAEAIIGSIQRFLSHYPSFQPLRDIMPDNSAFLQPSTDRSYANVGALERDHETRIDSLPNASGSVRLRQSDDSSETSFRLATAESYAESPYKRRRV
ncbi:kinase-like protein [Imleria badia]|nr:kinase-like protein [Imleria badia]